MAPYVTDIKAIKSSGSSENIELSGTTFNEGLTRIDMKIQDDVGGSGLDAEKTEVTVIDGNSNRVTGQDVTYGTNERRYIFSQPLNTKGDFTINVKAMDKAGNSRIIQYKFTINDIMPPEIINWILIDSVTNNQTIVPGAVVPHSFNRIKVEILDRGAGADYAASQITKIELVNSINNNIVIKQIPGIMSPTQAKPYIVYDLLETIRPTVTSNIYKITMSAVDLSPALNRIDTCIYVSLARSANIIVNTLTDTPVFIPANNKIKSSKDPADTKLVLILQSDTSFIRELWLEVYKYSELNTPEYSIPMTAITTPVFNGYYRVEWDGYRDDGVKITGGSDAEGLFYLGVYDKVNNIKDDHINWTLTVDNLPPAPSLVNIRINGAEDTGTPFDFIITNSSYNAEMIVKSDTLSKCKKAEIFIGSKKIYIDNFERYFNITNYIDSEALIKTNKFETNISVILWDEIGNMKEYIGYHLSITYNLPRKLPIIEITYPIGEVRVDTVGITVQGRASDGFGGKLDLYKARVWIRLHVFSGPELSTEEFLYTFTINPSDYNDSGNWFFKFFDNNITVQNNFRRYFMAEASDVDYAETTYVSTTLGSVNLPSMYYNKANNVSLRINIVDAEGITISQNGKCLLPSLIIPSMTFSPILTTTTNDALKRLYLYDNLKLIRTLELPAGNNTVGLLPAITDLKLQNMISISSFTVKTEDLVGNMSVMSEPLIVYAASVTDLIPMVIDALGNPIITNNPTFNAYNGEQLFIPLYTSGSSGAPAFATTQIGTKRIEIFTISGQRIFDAEVPLYKTNDTFGFKWDGTNYKGKRVNYGVYIMRVDGKVFPVRNGYRK